MTFHECMSNVAVSEWPAYFPALYDTMCADGSIDASALFEEDYIRAVSDRYALFTHQLDGIVESARLLREDVSLLRYANLLSAALLDRERLHSGPFPTLPPFTKDTPARHFVGMLAMLPAMAIADRFMREHDFEEDAVRRNFSNFGAYIDSYANRYGFAAIDQRYFNWLQHFIDVTILRHGGFNFEIVRSLTEKIVVLRHKTTGQTARLPAGTWMHREGMVLGNVDYEDEDGAYLADFMEDEEAFEGCPCGDDGLCTGVRTRYDRASWEVALRPGDAYISVHIPRGTNLKGRAFLDAAEGMLALARQYYPGIRPKAFCCFSWLMDRRIDAVCGGAPNIVNFQSAFEPFPIHSDEQEVTVNVFTKPFKSYEELPEDTRLMRAMKRMYMEGRHLHEFGGVMLIKDCPAR